MASFRCPCCGSPVFVVLKVDGWIFFQGGLDISPGGLREQCLTEMVARDLPGYAIGGLAGGEDKETFWRVVAHVRIPCKTSPSCFECKSVIFLSVQNAARLPANKPRYVMGVGYPLDLVVCVALGADMYVYANISISAC